MLRWLWGSMLKYSWIHSSDLEKGHGWDEVAAADGILVPGGFGSRGTEGKSRQFIMRAQNKVPYLGLCLGMQVMVVELAAMC